MVSPSSMVTSTPDWACWVWYSFAPEAATTASTRPLGVSGSAEVDVLMTATFGCTARSSASEVASLSPWLAILITSHFGMTPAASSSSSSGNSISPVSSMRPPLASATSTRELQFSTSEKLRGPMTVSLPLPRGSSSPACRKVTVCPRRAAASTAGCFDSFLMSA